MDNLGLYIKKKRESLNITQSQLSQMTKISVAVIDDLENDRFDLYSGDEMYVKAYLKKIGQALDLDIEFMTSTYVGLTREIKAVEMQEALEKERIEKENISKRNKIKLEDLKIDKPSFVRSKEVYDDHRTTKYIQTGVIVLIAIAIVGVLFYGVLKTKDHKTQPSFQSNTTTNIQGNTDENVSNKDNETQQENNQTESQEEPETALQFVRNGTLDFTANIPSSMDEITFKAEFGARCWSIMYLDEVQNKEFKSKVYNKDEEQEVKIPTTVKTIRLHNGYCFGHNFYVNGELLPLEDADQFTNTGDLIIRIEKAGAH